MDNSNLNQTNQLNPESNLTSVVEPSSTPTSTETSTDAPKKQNPQSMLIVEIAAIIFFIAFAGYVVYAWMILPAQGTKRASSTGGAPSMPIEEPEVIDMSNQKISDGILQIDGKTIKLGQSFSQFDYVNDLSYPNKSVYGDEEADACENIVLGYGNDISLEIYLVKASDICNISGIRFATEKTSFASSNAAKQIVFPGNIKLSDLTIDKASELYGDADGYSWKEGNYFFRLDYSAGIIKNAEYINDELFWQ